MKIEKIVKINKLEVNDSIFKENSYIEITLENVLSFEETKKIMDNFINKKVKLILESEESILADTEIKYLSGVIAPFKNKIKYIRKSEYAGCEYLMFHAENEPTWTMPLFKKGTMYKNMELYKVYTLEELGL